MKTDLDELFSELRSLGKKLSGVMKLVDGKLPQAMPYKRAAFELGIGLTELKMMVKLGMIQTVKYGEGKHPKVPLSEIRRLTTVEPLPVEVARGKPIKKRRGSSSAIMTPEELDEAIKKQR